MMCHNETRKAECRYALCRFVECQGAKRCSIERASVLFHGRNVIKLYSVTNSLAYYGHKLCLVAVTNALNILWP